MGHRRFRLRQEPRGRARLLRGESGTLAAPRHTTALDKPVGQWLTNIRRPGGLGKDPVRAERRAAQLAAVDPLGTPSALGWTVDWHRHYVGLAALLDEGALLTGIVPGVTWCGDGIGRWLLRQQRDFGRLNPEQQKRLSELGVKPAVQARTASAASGANWAGRGAEAFTRGLAALAQYVEREQRTVVPRQHNEQVTVDGQDHDVRLGVWVSNQKMRRDRLSEEQLGQLAGLGIDWA
ncbi:helicase associated domain-containing protein [Streptomyces sp. NBC_01431]|uniref:helicase associated domain-containing protein n=1 Tax=Streptomyces sp. NBC_01431 TaxID=2903863 RepID=UPI002E3730BC|nr:helicase associated domain-containing protein [Streptomyces sp. NBC_01431]